MKQIKRSPSAKDIPTGKRAVTYARYSTDKQTESSITDQQRACAEYAAKQGLVIVREYADEGISGAALGNRPDVRALERAAMAREFDVVLCADLSRPSRSYDLPSLIERLRFAGVQMIGVLDGFDSTSRHARMQAGLSALMSEELRAGIRDRVHLALESRAKTKRPTGGKVYGYTGQRVIVPQEAAIVVEVFDRAAAGVSMREIAADLNARAVPSPGASWKRTIGRVGGHWLITSLHVLLKNEMYVGRVVWNRRQFLKDPDTGKRVPRLRPESEWDVQQIPELAIVRLETFNKVQSIFSARAGIGGVHPGGKQRYLLSGLLICDVCGARLQLYGHRGQRYLCGSFHHGGVDACSNRLTVPRAEAEEKILGWVTEKLLSDDAVEAAVAMMRKFKQEKVVKAPDAGVADLDARTAKLRELVRNGTLDAQDAEPGLAKIEAERRAILAGATRAPKGQVIAGPWKLERAYRAAVKSMRDDLTGNIDAARAALQTILGPIRLKPDPERQIYEARYSVHQQAILQAMGAPSVVSFGSGGLIWNQTTLNCKGKKSGNSALPAN